nr:S8 family serine peptidase [Mesorhizobium amorphae]
MPTDPGRPAEQGSEESVDDITSACWAPEEPDLGDKKRWAISAIKADKAWALAKDRGLPRGGRGIVIAQPDTGITSHVELAEIPLRQPRNLLEDDRPDDPTDPMQSGGNPGHGTATASVVVSRSARDIIGSAPEASLMPIRAIERVTQPSMVKVAEAVDHAVAAGAHVITMSLGGIWSYSLWGAIERAVAADLLVMAAAGNCVGVVVWPAQFDACLGVAGVDQHFAPWRGTSMGPEVDISAPGQNVYRANAKTMDVGQGQGTSFAVALTAGVAACWLAYHGRASLIAAAHQRRETLQDMFKRLVRATAQRPSSGWNEMEMGAGVVDAEAILKADFDLGRETEGPVRSRLPADPTSSLRAIAADRLGAEALDPQIDWTGGGAEISLRLIRGTAAAATLPRRIAAPPVARSDARRARSGGIRRLRDQIVAGQAFASGASAESVQQLESTGNEPLTPAMAKEVMERVTARVVAQARARSDRETADRQAVQAALSMLQEHGAEALKKLTGLDGLAAAPLTLDEQASLEAIVIADGTRPSFLIEGGAPPAIHPFMGAWGSMVAPLQPELAILAGAVGRIQPSKGHNGHFIGTGSLVDKQKGVILTNYHVLDDAMQTFLIPMQRVSPTQIRVLADLEIDFLGEATSFASNRFRIVEANLHPNSGRGFGRLDAVTMKIEPIGAASVLPAAIKFSGKTIDFRGASGRNLCTIGFPGRPEMEQGPSGRVNWEFVLKTLFGDVFGVKRLAPGRVIRTPGDVEQDPLGNVFGHDATTFKGASGSPVFAWGVDGQPAIGLHFAGDIEVSNYSLTSAIVAEQFGSLGVPF